MKLSKANKIAGRITNEQLATMFEYAKKEIEDWRDLSITNKNITKGAAWNKYGKNFDVDKKYSPGWKIEAVQEFGDHLPGDIKRGNTKSQTRDRDKPYHEEPVF